MVPVTLVLRKIKFFQTLTMSKENFTQIACCDIVIIGFGQATLIYPGTQSTIEDTLISQFK